MNTKENKEISKVNLKNIYESLWRCRDFEISNLWQRSIFLTAYLLFTIGAYGKVLSVYFETSKDESSFVQVIFLQLILIVILILSLYFSVLWIKMAKGSKGWFEAYESAICAMEKNPEFSTELATKFGGFQYPKLPEYHGIEIEQSIFSTKAGEYSVSKINIGIGQAFFWVSNILLVGHIAWVYLYILECGGTHFKGIVVGTFLLVIIIMCNMCFCSSKKFRSNSMKYFKSRNQEKIQKKKT